MTSFTPIASLLGGMLIGLASALLLLLNGRIAGIAGIVGGLLSPGQLKAQWRWAFLLGLIAVGLVANCVAPQAMNLSGLPGYGTLIVAGVLVGVGTRVGGGCTSGHGVCGIARLSKRSIVATMIFMGTAILTVFVTRHVLGGLS